jgi:hypothetical protein
VLGQEGQQAPRLLEALVLRLGEEVGHARLHVVHLRAPQVVERDLLARRDPDDLRPGDEHVADPVDHEREVCHRGRVHGPARAGAEDQAELGDDAARLDVAPEDLGVAGQGHDPLLDAGAARVVDADDRHPVLVREVHDLAHLLGEDLAERAPERGRVVAEQHHVAPADRRRPGHDAVAGGPPVGEPEEPGPVPGEQVQLVERGAVHQPLDPLPSRQPALVVLPAGAGGVAVGRLVPALPQPVDGIDGPLHGQ